MAELPVIKFIYESNFIKQMEDIPEEISKKALDWIKYVKKMESTKRGRSEGIKRSS